MDKLTELGLKYGTDKIAKGHTYLPIYFQYFAHLQHEQMRLLEIGYGGWSKENGYNEPDLGGESARMWAEFFDHPRADIHVIDILPKNVKDKGYTFHQGSQTDRKFMEQFHSMDCIIDDGSHVSLDMINTFNILFPLMNNGGIYVIEDTQTSYWREFSPGVSTMAYFKTLCDGLNHAEQPGHKADHLDQHIFSIHFYHNLIFIFKGDNTEPSNTVRND